jgi:HJR/Mrr/RecB family endonuclease
VDPNELHKAIEIDELSPAAFEEQMSKYMEKRGWEIVARNNYDGGIDIRGFKEFKDGVIKKLIVQCKHWKKAIGPDVIRELIGAKEVEDDGYEKVMMVITSSRFTPGAREIADKHGVELIDGDMLLNETN